MACNDYVSASETRPSAAAGLARAEPPDRSEIVEAVIKMVAEWAEERAEPVRESDKSDVEGLNRYVIQQNGRHPYHGRMWQYLKDNW